MVPGGARRSGLTRMREIQRSEMPCVQLVAVRRAQMQTHDPEWCEEWPIRKCFDNVKKSRR
jgi:hypothetical protein